MSQLTFTLVQSSIFWEDKNQNMAMFEEKIRSISTNKQIVILPETFNTGFAMTPERLSEAMDGPTVRWMQQLAKQEKIILVGSIMITESQQHFNRLLWVLPNGQIQHYDKRHRFSLGGEQEQFTQGSRRVIVQVNGWRILLQICYDLRFPVFSRQQSTDEYDAILYIANWPEKRMLAWNTLLRARAIENQCFAIGVNRIGQDGNGISHSGGSAVYNPLGKAYYHKENEADIHTITLDKTELITCRNNMPFQQDADAFTLLGM